ncbi:keratin, type I cytoskeletal 9-like isoform X2 [Lutzomyia longipalpis]|uniref:keratin, type I cytoskeletal 9-like isoform X2 n=1 Tax=Lutzomyia longipalpis TaxID=7200 RepID=UPI00248337D5|nr:keratin, type I cytoskeletal 9-like isoform X2 [Lutzomyia longipalpis]
MQLFVGLFTLFCALHITLGYSTPTGGLGASSSAGSFASAGTAAQAGGLTGGAALGGATTALGAGGSYGSQYPYTDNSLGSSAVGGTTGGGSYGGSYGGGSYGGGSYDTTGGFGGGTFSGGNYGGGTTGTGGNYGGGSTGTGGAFAGASGGAYVGTGAAPFVPQAALYPTGPSQQDYQNLFVNFWKSLSDNYAKLISQQLAHQAALFNQINAAGSRFGGADAGAGLGGGYYAPNYASSSASLGPQGAYQTANIIPANPNSPNVDTLHGSGGNPVVSMSVGPPGFYGVSSSSFSSSSDINGHVQSHREAQTTVNDNGKVTTYTVKS